MWSVRECGLYIKSVEHQWGSDMVSFFFKIASISRAVDDVLECLEVGKPIKGLW